MFSHTTACRTDNQYWSYTSLFVPSIWRFPNFHVLLSSDEMSAAGSTHLKRLSIQRSESHSALPLNYERYVSMVRQLGHPPQPREMMEMVQLVVPYPPPRARSATHSTSAPCPVGSLTSIWLSRDANSSSDPVPASNSSSCSGPFAPLSAAFRETAPVSTNW